MPTPSPTLAGKQAKQLFKQAAAAISRAEALLITTGAGMGVDSGLPDFRGKEGFWNAYPPIKEKGLSFPEVSTPHWFKDDPEFAWGFFGHRMNLYNKTTPHKGHDIILKWAKEKESKRGCFFFTSNVDGQLIKAGVNEQKIVECHGSLRNLQCCNDCKSKLWSSEDIKVEVDENFKAVGKLPECPSCHDLARPNVLMFGDYKWNGEETMQQETRYKRWFSALGHEIKLAVIEIGAGNEIVCSAVERMGGDATLIRINIHDSEIPESASYSKISLGMSGLEALEAIAKY